MTIDATREASIKHISDYVYNVQEVEPNKTTKEELQELGQNIVYGVPMMVALPTVMKLGQKPYSVWKYMQQNPGISWSQASDFLAAQRAQEKQALQYLKAPNSRWLTLKNKHLFNRVQDLKGIIPSYDINQDISKLQGKDLIKYQNAQRSSRYYGEARKLIEEAKAKKMTGAELKAQLKKIYAAMRKGDARVSAAMEKGLLKPTSKFGAAKHWLKSKTGGYKFESKMLKSVKGANALRTACKFGKGAGLMAVIEGVMEIPDIISAFKIDSKRGTKQLTKSTVKVGASVLGYAAGAAATGAVLGSVVPGIGNVVGGIIGFAGGLIGGWLTSKVAGKVMDKVMGEKNSLNKSETQLYAEEENQKNKLAAEEAAKAAATSNETLDQLLTMANEKCNQEGSWSSQEVLDSFDKLVKERESSIQQGDYTTNVDTSLGEQTIQGTDDWYLHQLNNLGRNFSFVPVAQSVSNSAENIYNYGQNLYLNW